VRKTRSATSWHSRPGSGAFVGEFAENSDAVDFLTGASVAACQGFVECWPQCGTPKAKILLIDSFIHELHGGPLAPLFIRGSKGAVAALLDELAA